MKPQTVWATKPEKKATVYVDPDQLVIADDPIPAGRSLPKGKYDAIFEALKFGQCIRCKVGEASKIGHALDKWLERHGKRGIVKTMMQYDDTSGRVWLLPKPAREPKLKAAS